MPSRDPLERHASTPEELVTLNAARRTGQAFLAWRDDGGGLQVHPLGDAGDTIGRGEETGICLAWDPRVSKVHAELRILGGEWVIVDDGLSRNGTYVDAERVTGRRRLHHDARIQVGDTMLAFQAAGNSGDATKPGGRILQRGDLQPNEQAVLCALCRPLILRTSEEPAPNTSIATEVHLTEDGVKRCLTRLYRLFEIAENPKRRRLAQRAISTGTVRRTDYS